MTIAAYKTIGNLRKAVIGLLLVGASCVSSQASAALVNFNLTGDVTANFTVNQSPTPSIVNFNNFRIDNVSGIFQGSPAIFKVAFGGGDFGFSNGNTELMAIGFGSPLWSGTTAAPKFILGDYSFHGFTSVLPESVRTDGHYFLSITSVPGGVPEPSTWMMMVAGFGLLGGAMRYGNNARAGAKTASLT